LATLPGLLPNERPNWSMKLPGCLNTSSTGARLTFMPTLGHDVSSPPGLAFGRDAKTIPPESTTMYRKPWRWTQVLPANPTASSRADAANLQVASTWFTCGFGQEREGSLSRISPDHVLAGTTSPAGRRKGSPGTRQDPPPPSGHRTSWCADARLETRHVGKP